MPVYSLKDVAEHLGMHPQTVKYHIYTSKYFAGLGTVIGQALVFTDDELAKMVAIKAKMPAPGRKAAPPPAPEPKVKTKAKKQK